MKVTVLQENLARGLGVVSKAVSPRSTLPVLANVLIASDEVACGSQQQILKWASHAGFRPASMKKAQRPCRLAHFLI